MNDPRLKPALGGNAVASRPSVIQLVFREKGALYAAYIPMLAEGGLFVPTTREYKLGEDIYLLLSLPEDKDRLPVIKDKLENGLSAANDKPTVYEKPAEAKQGG